MLACPECSALRLWTQAGSSDVLLWPCSTTRSKRQACPGEARPPAGMSAPFGGAWMRPFPQPQHRPQPARGRQRPPISMHTGICGEDDRSNAVRGRGGRPLLGARPVCPLLGASRCGGRSCPTPRAASCRDTPKQNTIQNRPQNTHTSTPDQPRCLSTFCREGLHPLVRPFLTSSQPV